MRDRSPLSSDISSLPVASLDPVMIVHHRLELTNVLRQGMVEFYKARRGYYLGQT